MNTKNGRPVGNVRIGRRYNQVERECLALWPDCEDTLIAAAPVGTTRTPKTMQEVYDELFGVNLPQ